MKTLDNLKNVQFPTRRAGTIHTCGDFDISDPSSTTHVIREPWIWPCSPRVLRIAQWLEHPTGEERS